MGQPRHRAAHLHRAGATIDGWGDRSELVAGIDGLGHRRPPFTPEIDTDHRRLVAVPQPDLPTALEDDALTIRRGVPDVELRVGQAAQVGELRQPIGWQRRGPQLTRPIAIGHETERGAAVEPQR